MPPKPDARRGVASSLAVLAARAALVAGSIAMAVRVVVPQPKARRVEDQGNEDQGGGESDETGRGRHTIPASRRAVTAGHETEDMNARTMARVLITLGGVAVIMVFVMIGFESLIIPPREHRFATLPLQDVAHPTPPAPNLQSDPVAELARLNAAADNLLDHYAQIDADHARVPIDRAMALAVGRSLDTAP